MKTTYEKIYEAVEHIPAGKVATYGQIAELIGNKKLSRVVGNALHKNPNPEKFPCHRVVNSKGELSKMYAFGGLKKQEEILVSECIEVQEGKVDLRRYQWKYFN